jgi:ABC-type molybdate transport system permease subunit
MIETGTALTPLLLTLKVAFLATLFSFLAGVFF